MSKLTVIQANELIGKIFTKLTVIEYQYNEDNKLKHFYKCLCSCGNYVIKPKIHLLRGSVKSCGCLQKERPNNTKHNFSGTSIYNCWLGIKDRCYNKNTKRYKNYGGRGIVVCERWLESFENFYEDIGDKPTLKHSLDRINNDDNYCKENCKWSTDKEQANNKTTNHLVEYQNEIKNISEWAELLNIKYSLLLGRLKRGWSMDDIVNTPVKNVNPLYEYNGEFKSLRAWSKIYNISKTYLQEKVTYKNITLKTILDNTPLREV